MFLMNQVVSSIDFTCAISRLHVILIHCFIEVQFILINHLNIPQNPLVYKIYYVEEITAENKQYTTLKSEKSIFYVLLFHLIRRQELQA